ncbi:hypothetical protein [Methylobacterium sp. CM6257]
MKNAIEIFPSGKQDGYWSENDRTPHFEVPVLWRGQPAIMQFFGETPDTPYNPIATRLLDHQHLRIRGSAFIVTGAEERYKMRAWATYKEVTDAIAHIGLSAPPVIFSVGVLVAQQDIYAATADDLFAIRMCL